MTRFAHYKNAPEHNIPILNPNRDLILKKAPKAIIGR